MISVGYNATKAMFFDRARVQRALDDGSRKVLSKFGAFVRRRAKSSIRKRKAVSQPGKPPSSHVGTLRNLIFFGYDPVLRSVVIGPTQSQSGSIVPRVLEYGGRLPGRAKGGPQELRYRARPFMGPAFEAELPSLPPLWRNAVH